MLDRQKYTKEEWLIAQNYPFCSPLSIKFSCKLFYFFKTKESHIILAWYGLH